MKRIASLLLVLAVLLCGCSTVNEGIIPGDNAVADEQNAFVYDADNEEIPIESSDPSENEKEATVTEEIKEEQESSTQEEEPISPTVYRTESGECYHREGCYHLKSKFKTTVERAQAMGLRACSRCHPPR